MSVLHDHPAYDTDAGTRLSTWLWTLVSVAMIVAVMLWAPGNQDAPMETPPEPTDTKTRTTCRLWQVAVAASGIQDYPAATDPAERTTIVEDLLTRTETVASVREAEQETFLALVAVIETARRLKTTNPAERETRYTAVTEAMSLVEETCDPTV